MKIVEMFDVKLITRLLPENAADGPVDIIRTNGHENNESPGSRNNYLLQDTALQTTGMNLYCVDLIG